MLKRLALAALLALGTLSPALADRYALVVGNDAYAELPPLQKAVNDATAVAAALESQGFAVTLLTDAGRRAMTRGLSDLAARIRPGDEALFYFAGHGVEVAGRNYLLPADAPAVKPEEESFLTAESVAADDVVFTLQGRGAAVTVLILDACRDNPFPREGTRSAGSARGLAPIAPPEGSFILFSAGAGQTALDRLGGTDHDPNSVFTRALLPLLARGDLTLPELARLLRGEVEATAATIGHKQRPAYYDELTGDYAIATAAGRGAVPLGTTVADAPVADPAACAAAAADWPAVVALQDPLTMRAFAEAHAACVPLSHAALAEADRLDTAKASDPGAAQPEDWPEVYAAAPPPDDSAAVAEVAPAAVPEQAAAAQPMAPLETWRVRLGVSEGYVNVRQGAGTMHRILFSIAAGAGGIEVDQCRPPDPGGGSFDWCFIRYGGQEGWVSSNGIERE